MGLHLRAEAVDLVVAPCSHEAASTAVKRWHYSRKMPVGKLVRYGVWEEGAFVGAVIFGRGATPQIGKAFGLDQTKVCELVRVALRDGHRTPVSRVVSLSLERLRTTNPGLRLVLSFADLEQGHVGKIYQAGNWTYLGKSGTWGFQVRGRFVHWRGLRSRVTDQPLLEWLRKNVDPEATRALAPKFRYGYPLDRAMRRRLRSFALPYPRGLGVDSDTSGLRSEGAGATPADRSRRTPRSRQPRN